MSQVTGDDGVGTDGAMVVGMASLCTGAGGSGERSLLPVQPGAPPEHSQSHAPRYPHHRLHRNVRNVQCVVYKMVLVCYLNFY